MLLSKDSSTSKEDINQDSDSENPDQVPPQPFATRHRACMFHGNEIGFVWSSCHSYESVQKEESNDRFISLQDACTFLSEYVAEIQNFRVKSIELVYQTEFEYENAEKAEWGYIQSIYCHPAYHFSMANAPAGYAGIYFDVDALTGKVTTMIR